MNEILYDLTRADVMPTFFLVLIALGIGTLLVIAYIIWHHKTCNASRIASTFQGSGAKLHTKPYRGGVSAPRLYRMTERGDMLGDSKRNKKSYAPASV